MGQHRCHLFQEAFPDCCPSCLLLPFAVHPEWSSLFVGLGCWAESTGVASEHCDSCLKDAAWHLGGAPQKCLQNTARKRQKVGEFCSQDYHPELTEGIHIYNSYNKKYI
jgi:hypothetical protein